MGTGSRQRVESNEVAVSPAKGKRGAEVEGLGEESILLIDCGRRRGHRREGQTDYRPWCG